MHARATDEERRWFDTQGQVSESATLRTMGRTLNGEEQALIEIKAVDGRYPLVGEVPTNGIPLRDSHRRRRRRGPGAARAARPQDRRSDAHRRGLGPRARHHRRRARRHCRPPHLRPARVPLARDARQDQARAAGHARSLALCAGASRRRRPFGRYAVGDARPRQGSASRRRLHGGGPARSLAAGDTHARPASAVPDIPRPDCASRRRCRRRQCGCDVHRAAARRHRDDEEPRRHGQSRVLDVPGAGAGHRAHRCRHRSPGGPGNSAGARRTVRRCTADQGRDFLLDAQRAVGHRLRRSGVAAVHAVAAGAGGAGQRQRAVPR